jgi:hypothetical protein
LIVLAASGCTVDSDNGATSLGDPTYGTTVPTTMSTSFGTSTATDASGSGSSSSDGEEASSAGSTMPDSTDSGSSGASGGSSGGIDEQPENGVYAACESAFDCVGAVYCISVMPNVGFCSKNCSDPTVDCPDSPGGTATSACVAAMPNGTPATVCALDCSGGKTCPGGMECAQLDTSMVCV